MKATWMAPFVLALATTPAIANDMDTDTNDGQMTQGSSQMSTGAASSNAETMSDGQMSSHDNDMDTGMGHADTDSDGQMTRHDDNDMAPNSDTGSDNLKMDKRRDSDMGLDTDSDS